MNSGLTFFTSGSSPIAITSSAVTRTRLPARSPPACRLVWPGNATTVPSENAPRNPASSAPRKPSPYESSTTTEMMPHEMPSIDNAARKR